MRSRFLNVEETGRHGRIDYVGEHEVAGAVERVSGNSWPGGGGTMQVGGAEHVVERAEIATGAAEDDLVAVLDRERSEGRNGANGEDAGGGDRARIPAEVRAEGREGIGCERALD